MSIALHTVALLATCAAVPFTPNEAIAADKGIMGRYSRAYLKQVLRARRSLRQSLKAAISGGSILQANELATLIHSVGVQAVLLIRRNARAH